MTNSPRTHFAFFQLLPVEPFFEFRASALNAHAILKLWAALDIQLQSKDCWQAQCLILIYFQSFGNMFSSPTDL